MNSVMLDTPQRCNTCVLPRSTRIEFEDGTCALCRAKPDPQLFAPLPELLERCISEIRERGKGRPYDCLVGVSGGRDSTYLLYTLVRKHQLRCLAAYYRTPFTPQVIDENVKRLVKTLNVPLLEMDIPWEFHRKLARTFVLLWKKKPLPTISNLSCAPCKLVNREVFRLARKNKVPTIVFGGNKFEWVPFLPSAVATSNVDPEKTYSFSRQLKRALSLLKKGVGLLSQSIATWQYIPIGIQSALMYINPHTAFLRMRYPDIKAIEYFHYSGWEESKCNRVLDEVGWVLPPACHSKWKADCSFGEIKNYMFRSMMGTTYIDAFFSNMVRAGVLEREEALSRAETEGTLSMQRIQEACDAMDLPASLFPEL